MTATFTYDALGRRQSKKLNAATTQFLYDGLNPVQELNGKTVVANLLTGLGIDEYLTRTSAAGARNFLADALGSTVALADATGAVPTQYTYEPFGATGVVGTDTNSFQFTGRENDGAGLSYHRARYYHPGLQRFVSEDPLGPLGGDLNLFVYVLNAPLDFTDRIGLEKTCSGSARVLAGNPALIGMQGGLAGVLVAAGSAAIIPAQWGMTKGELAPYLAQIRGGGAAGSFVGITDIIGGASPIPGVNVRDALQILYPGVLIIELPTGRDLGIIEIALIVPRLVPCPTGTFEGSVF